MQNFWLYGNILSFAIQVCLDEAQMVESTHAKVRTLTLKFHTHTHSSVYYSLIHPHVQAAEMMMKVTAVNKWCVTGTPVQKCLLGTSELLFSAI